MHIGSHVSATEKDSPAAWKRGVPLDEFLLSVLVVAAAILLGIVGGIWLAGRDRPASRQAAVPPPPSVQLSSQPPDTAPERRKADLPATRGPRAPAKEPDREIISLGLPSVRTIHHSYRPDFTEIAIELRAAVLLRVAQLYHPERVYFDLAESGQTRRPKGRLKSRREVSISDDRVAGVRVVLWESGSVRVVVDLKRPCEYSYRLSSGPPSLLILELHTHPPGTLASHRAPRLGVAGGSGGLAASSP